MMYLTNSMHICPALSVLVLKHTFPSTLNIPDMKAFLHCRTDRN